MALVYFLLLSLLGRALVDVESAGECSAAQPCPSGLCCSQWGYCGTGPEYCGLGCRSNCWNNGTISAKLHEDPICDANKLCANHLCCSQWGFCGDTEPYCGIGCQSGPCWFSQTAKTLLRDEHRSSLPEATLREDPICDANKLCANHLCCSQWGFCGDTEPYCGIGCQSGPCWFSQTAKTLLRDQHRSSLPEATLREDPICDANKLCANHLCCSQWGFCGDTEPYCGIGCQSGPCWFSQTAKTLLRDQHRSSLPDVYNIRKVAGAV